MSLKSVVSGYRRSYLRPLRLRYADGGTYLAVKAQAALKGDRNIVRINHQGILRINGTDIGSSYGTRHLGSMMNSENLEQREIIIIGGKNLTGKNIESVVAGLNTNDPDMIRQVGLNGMIFTKDPNHLNLLYASNVRTVKMSPSLDFTDQELAKISIYLEEHPEFLNDFKGFSSEQRLAILKLLQRDLIGGLFHKWKEMDQPTKEHLLSQLAGLEVEIIYRNTDAHRRYVETKGVDTSSNCEQITGKLDLPNTEEIVDVAKLPKAERDEYARIGREYIASGKFGVMVLAGGVAQRFGQGPKALIEIEPGTGRTFMKVVAEDVFKASVAARRDIPLLIGVVRGNIAQIDEHCTANDSFGLKKLIPLLQDRTLPRIYPDGTLSLMLDRPELDFVPTGHGLFVKGLKTHRKIMQSLGIETLFIKNIDGLGATVRDRSYHEILGYHRVHKSRLTVELVQPKVKIDPVSGKVVLIDKGGTVVSRDGRNVLAELFAIPKKLQDYVAHNPFNTLNLTLEESALDNVDPNQLPWYITHKDIRRVSPDGVEEIYRRYQYEQLLGDLTHQVPTSFLQVQREGKFGRFVPVKTPQELVSALPVFHEMEALKD